MLKSFFREKYKNGYKNGEFEKIGKNLLTRAGVDGIVILYSDSTKMNSQFL